MSMEEVNCGRTDVRNRDSEEEIKTTSRRP